MSLGKRKLMAEDGDKKAKQLEKLLGKPQWHD